MTIVTTGHPSMPPVTYRTMRTFPTPVSPLDRTIPREASPPDRTIPREASSSDRTVPREASPPDRTSHSPSDSRNTPLR